MSLIFIGTFLCYYYLFGPFCVTNICCDLFVLLLFIETFLCNYLLGPFCVTIIYWDLFVSLFIGTFLCDYYSF